MTRVVTSTPIALLVSLAIGSALMFASGGAQRYMWLAMLSPEVRA